MKDTLEKEKERMRVVRARIFLITLSYTFLSFIRTKFLYEENSSMDI